MVAVQNVLDAARADETVAGVADNLEPGLQVVGTRAHAAAQVAGSSAAADAVKRVAGIEFHQEAVINAGQRPRSEERRVGKECRSRWAAEHERKKRKAKVKEYAGI